MAGDQKCSLSTSLSLWLMEADHQEESIPPKEAIAHSLIGVWLNNGFFAVVIIHYYNVTQGRLDGTTNGHRA